MADWAGWMVVVSALTVLVTAVGVYFVRETLHEAGETTRAAARSADAAQASVDVAQNTAKHELRAYVSVEPETVESFDATTTTRVKIKVTNLGKTPAHSMQHKIGIQIFQYPYPEELPFPYLDDKWSRKTVIFPGESFFGDVASAEPFPISHIKRMIAGDGRLYIIVEVRYFDEFKEPHTTKAGYSVTGDIAILTGGPGAVLKRPELRFEVTAQHNKAT